jgi:cytochrome c oxidase subunit II
MFKDFPLFPEAVSTIAPDIDALYLFIVAVCGFMTIAISGVVLYFAIRYRRRPGNEVPLDYKPSIALEITWIIIPFVVFMGFFAWGAIVFFEARRMPDNALDVWATGRQWMWKFQHVGGKSEINTLHVPVNQPIRLIMTSEDVIHDFFVPEFRVHTDVLPGRYTYNWFEATKTGEYNLFCSEYCGTEHSKMIGKVIVMEPADFQLWLAGGEPEGTPAAEGKKLFEKFACNTCHQETSGARGPVLVGLFGHEVKLQDGSVVIADENYIRQSILNPQSQIVAGYQPIMPTFQGQVNEAQLMQLVSYIKSLKPPETAASASEATQNAESK